MKGVAYDLNYRCKLRCNSLPERLQNLQLSLCRKRIREQIAIKHRKAIVKTKFRAFLDRQSYCYHIDVRRHYY